MPGPPRQPTERKRKRGNPGHQKLPSKTAEVIPLHKGVDCDVPAQFGPAGSEMWATITEFAATWLAESDRQLVLMCCEAADRRAELMASIQDAGSVFYTDKGYAYANPAVGMLQSLEKQLTSWLSLLGLTPSDRSRLGLAEVKAQSKMAELEERKSKQRGR